MKAPVNLDNLRSMTDGDKDMEQELFKEFYSSFEAGIALMQGNNVAGDSEMWRKEAHALKGIALNLGAEKLGGLCKTAQESHNIAKNIKVELLKNIRMEYERVKEFLLNAGSA